MKENYRYRFVKTKNGDSTFLLTPDEMVRVYRNNYKFNLTNEYEAFEIAEHTIDRLPRRTVRRIFRDKTGHAGKKHWSFNFDHNSLGEETMLHIGCKTFDEMGIFILKRWLGLN